MYLTAANLIYYLARGSGCEVLWWVCLSVCLFVCPREYLRNHTRDLYQIFVHIACVGGSVFLRHVDNRPHRLSAGRGDGSAQRGRSVIYDCLVIHLCFSLVVSYVRYTSWKSETIMIVASTSTSTNSEKLYRSCTRPQVPSTKYHISVHIGDNDDCADFVV